MNMLQHFSVVNRLRIGFGIVLVLLAVVALVGLLRLQVLAGSLQEIAVEDMSLLQRMAQLQATVLQSGSAVRDAVAQEDLKVLKESIKTINENHQREVVLLKEIGELTAKHVEHESGMIKPVSDNLEKLRKETQATLDLVDAAEYDAAKRQVIDSVRPLQSAAEMAISSLYKHKTEEANEAAGRAATAVTVTRLLIIVLSLVAVGAGLGVAWLISRSIITPLRSAADFANRVSQGDLSQSIRSDSRDEVGTLLTALESMRIKLVELIRRIHEEGDQTSRLSTDLASRNRQVSSQAQIQTDRIMAVSAAIEEMATTIQQVSESAAGVKSASAEAQAMTREGNEIMRANLAEVEGVLSGVRTSTAIVEELSEAVAKISGMAQVIKDIADQTNLLALNAAIEAARAGEQGRGFAVVADEVRKLAEPTTASTADIASKVKEISVRSKDAVDAMARVLNDVQSESDHSRQVGERLGQLLDSAMRVAELASHIANATQEQASASQAMNGNLADITHIADKTLEAIQSAQSSAEQMDRTASELKRLVSKFKLDR